MAHGGKGSSKQGNAKKTVLAILSGGARVEKDAAGRSAIVV
jgi:hypothetical protein